jgi:lysophospholipase L1-like esterase
VHTLVSVDKPGSMTWPTGRRALPSFGEGAVSSASLTDLTLSGGIAVNAANIYGPIAIRGVADSLHPTFAIVGDSIADGTGDSFDAFGNRDYIARGLGDNYAYTQLTRAADVARFFAGKETPRNYTGRLATGSGAITHMICSLGRNDVTGGDSLAEMQRNLRTVWRLYADRGIKVYQTTISPITTSTDKWRTTTGQTIIAHEANRVALNDWIRTTPAPLSGYFDAVDYFETARNSGIWKVNGEERYFTDDGTHPSAAAHKAAAASIDSSLF